MKNRICNYLNKIKDSKAQRRGIAFVMALTVLFGNGLFYLPDGIVTAEEVGETDASTIAETAEPSADVPEETDAAPSEEETNPELSEEMTEDVTDGNQQPDEETDPEDDGTEFTETDEALTYALSDGPIGAEVTAVAYQLGGIGAYGNLLGDTLEVYKDAGTINIRVEIKVDGDVEPNPEQNGFLLGNLGNFTNSNDVIEFPMPGTLKWTKTGTTYGHQTDGDGNEIKGEDGKPITDWSKIESTTWQLILPVTLKDSGDTAIKLLLNGDGASPATTINVVVKDRLEPETMLIKSSYITWAEDDWLDKHDATNMMDGQWAGNVPEGIWSEENSEATPLTIYIGGTLEVTAQEGTAGTKLVYSDVNGNGTGILDGTSDGTSGTYTGMKPGVGRIEVQNDNGDILSTLYVKVKYPIYVDIGSGGIHKDKTHEYLQAAVGWDDSLEFLDDDKKDDQVHLYIKNKDSIRGCYVITVGETRELIGYSDDPNTRFELVSGTNTSDSDLVHQTAEPWRVNGIYRITAKYTPASHSYVGDTNDHKTNTIQFGDEKFYVRVYRGTATATHADIEVEDGGSYRDSFTVYHADGSYTVISSKYSAEVVYVNQCDIYYNDAKMQAELSPEEFERAARKIESSEYGDNRTGGTQHEFTSAFKSTEKTEPDLTVGEYIDEAGKVRDKYGNLMYDVLEPWNPIPANPTAGWTISRAIYRAYLDHVDFNVQLALTLLDNGVTAVSYDANNNPIPFISEDQKYVDEVQKEILLENFEYRMDDAAIAAAYNKCPDRSGLDFKLVADVNQVLIEVNPQVLKTVNDKEPGDGNEFEFGLYSDAACTNPVRNEANQPITVKTDKNGIALFSADALVFTGEGTNTFYIKEIIPGTPKENMVYDDHVETVTIRVEKDNNDQLTATINYSSGGNVADFNNTTKYLLPDAGGIGTRPYVISGIMLMQTAILLFYLHRRRGARH